MPAKKDLTGQVFGLLTVISEASPVYYNSQKKIRWHCKCRCGQEIDIVAQHLSSGNTKSCGCYEKEVNSTKHTRDLVGMTFGRLKVISKYDVTPAGKVRWKCACDCGNEKVITGSNLISGKTKSCGCLRAQDIGNLNYIHGESSTRLYMVWRGMRERCNNPNHISYQLYGGRGISVCSAWDDFAEFKLWAEANGYNPKAKRGECTLDRVDSDGSYCPENCRWVNMYIQSNNRRNSKHNKGIM